MNHFLLVNKPPGISTYYIVERVKEITGIKKVGHMGTLDPRACGLVIIGLDKAVRLEEFIIRLDKTYITEIIFGIKSDSFDRDSKSFYYQPVDINVNDVERELEYLKGEMEQVPPEFSAVKVKGKRAYELARKGEKFELSPKKITVYSSKLLYFKKEKFPKALVEFTVSSGTYIRSLVGELGSRLNVFAMTSFLLRTMIGNFSINDAILFKNLRKEWKDRLIPAIKLLNLPTLVIPYELEPRIKNGNPIKTFDNSIVEGTIALVNQKDELIAIAQYDGKLIKPKKVFL